MKPLEMIGLLAVLVAALMASAGTASATITTTTYSGEIAASSSNSEIDGAVDLKCAASTIAGSNTAGGTTFALTTVSFTECGTDTVTVINNGSLRFDSAGTVYWEGAETTAQVHRMVFGFAVTTHCIYAMAANPGTDIGTLTEGTTTITLTGTSLAQKETDGACGSNAQWTGTYTITKPGPLTID